MNQDYLWDRSGPPDPEIEQWERRLSPLRYRLARQAPHRAPHRAPGRWRALAIAAMLLAGLGLWQLAITPSRPTAWQVARLEGTARLGGRNAAVAMIVRSGQLVRTAGASQLTLEAGPLGRLDIGPDSELQAATDRQVELRRGAIHAFIWAPPRAFVVDTASARAVDLGCEYTLEVNGAGDGLLRVLTGWVALGFEGHECFIPAGARCLTRPRKGPGIPFYEDAAEPFQRALGRFESGDRVALGEVLAAARPRDALTLWHLLTRVPAEARAPVFDRLAQLVTLGPEVTRAAALRADAHTIDLCWNALHLANTEWWRGWEQAWKP